METDLEENNICSGGKNFEVRKAGDHKGLGIFACKDFKEDEIILEEEPLVAAQFYWNEKYGYSACHHCLRPLESTDENIKRLTNNAGIVLPYPNLCPTNKTEHVYCECGVGFCNANCKELGWKQYHQYLCSAEKRDLSKLLQVWSNFHYPPETSTIMLLLKMIATIELSKNYDEAVSTFLQFAHECESEEMLMKFLGPKYSDNLRMIYSILHEILPCKFVKEFVTEDGLKKLFALIGRNGQGIGTSVFSEWVKKVEKLDVDMEEKIRLDNFIDTTYQAMNDYVGTFLNCEGSGLYKMQKNINHSCNPNAAVTFPYSNSTLSIVAGRDIAVGEEICISYLDKCMLDRSRHTRRCALRDYYLFDCECEKCIEQADDPDVTSEEETDSEDEDAMEES